jgi:hypothetical protein
VEGTLRLGRSVGIEKRGERIGLAAIDQISDEKLVLKAFGVAGAAQEREQAAYLGVRMYDHAIVAGDGGDDQSAKGAAVAQGGGIDGVQQFHAQERALGEHAEDVGGGCFHAGLQLEIYDGAGGNLQRDNVPGSRGRERTGSVQGLCMRGKCGKSQRAGEQREKSLQRKDPFDEL